MIDPSVMPELPAAFHIYGTPSYHAGRTAVYSDDQMREYFAQGYRIALERAAQACEEFGNSYNNEWNRKLGVANDLKDACEECAGAIRDLALQENPALERMARIDDELGEQP